MAVSTNLSQFGKRPIHEVWAEQDSGGDAVRISPLRGWLAVAILAALAVVLARVALAVADNAPPAALSPLHSVAAIVMALAPAVLALASVWVAVAVLRLLLQRGPVLRLDSKRVAMRTRFGEVSAAWEEVMLSFGPLFLKIRFRDVAGAEEAPDPVLIPLLLLPGGATGLRAAIRRARPDALQPSAA